MKGRVLSDYEVRKIESNITSFIEANNPLMHLHADKDALNLISTIRDKEAQIGECERLTQRWREQAWNFEHMNKILNEELEKRDATIAEYKSYGDDWRKSHDELFTKYRILFNALCRAEKGLNHLANGTASDPLLLAQSTWERVCEAIAKVGETE